MKSTYCFMSKQCIKSGHQIDEKVNSYSFNLNSEANVNAIYWVVGPYQLKEENVA